MIQPKLFIGNCFQAAFFAYSFKGWISMLFFSIIDVRYPLSAWPAWTPPITSFARTHITWAETTSVWICVFTSLRARDVTSTFAPTVPTTAKLVITTQTASPAKTKIIGCLTTTPKDVIRSLVFMIAFVLSLHPALTTVWNALFSVIASNAKVSIPTTLEKTHVLKSLQYLSRQS